MQEKVKFIDLKLKQKRKTDICTKLWAKFWSRNFFFVYQFPIFFDFLCYFFMREQPKRKIIECSRAWQCIHYQNWMVGPFVTENFSIKFEIQCCVRCKGYANIKCRAIQTEIERWMFEYILRAKKVVKDPFEVFFCI